MSVQGICKLCLQEKELCNSHIIPEFMYNKIYNEKPRKFFLLKYNNKDSTLSKKRPEQKGIREYLLCSECEGKLSKYEIYGEEVIYAKGKRNKAYIFSKQETPDLQFSLFHYKGLNYHRFRLFLLSILWRLIICKTFPCPHIDEVEVDRLRKAIYNENPLEYDDFGCTIQAIFYSKDKLANRFMLQPYSDIKEGKLGIFMLIDGFLYSYFIDTKTSNDKLKATFLQSDGSMIMLGRLLKNDEFLNKVVSDVFKHFGSELN